MQPGRKAIDKPSAAHGGFTYIFRIVNQKVMKPGHDRDATSDCLDDDRSPF
jgi:hypothetical protein